MRYLRENRKNIVAGEWSAPLGSSADHGVCTVLYVLYSLSGEFSLFFFSFDLVEISSHFHCYLSATSIEGDDENLS